MIQSAIQDLFVVGDEMFEDHEVEIRYWVRKDPFIESGFGLSHVGVSVWWMEYDPLPVGRNREDSVDVEGKPDLYRKSEGGKEVHWSFLGMLGLRCRSLEARAIEPNSNVYDERGADIQFDIARSTMVLSWYMCST